ncbi:hypothetical protein DVJ83_18875 (plasmid) [Deinococcus wulumuqiensis]|uniref:Uncharacterized protein n=1 Tax=Deinococcus wulumuqiensis TaxID=980427 RepID=A0A345INC3_9DEIO|nr:hypothetical protein [Deinococcus wulumuqiensis]AXH01196.1 hypothetical protein DVJ83_18875 [Deinococcus wulumuqiensis]
MPQKKKQPTSSNRDRVVYEVRIGNTPRQVEATTTAELKKALLPLLNLDPYSVQAAAHLAHVERATVTGKGWSVKRVGVLSFVADEEPKKAPTGNAQRRQDDQPTTAPTADDATQEQGQQTPDSAHQNTQDTLL